MNSLVLGASCLLFCNLVMNVSLLVTDVTFLALKGYALLFLTVLIQIQTAQAQDLVSLFARPEHVNGQDRKLSATLV